MEEGEPNVNTTEIVNQNPNRRAPSMDLKQEELQHMSIAEIVRASIKIPQSSPRTFGMLTLTLVFPLSFAVLAHPLLTHPLLARLDPTSPSAAGALALLAFFQTAYLLVLFVFSLLSTAAVVFSAASLYAAKPISFPVALSAVGPIFPRLFNTFLWTSILLLIYNLAFAASAVLLVALLDGPDSTSTPAFLLAVVALLLFFLLVHVYVSALWHLASVVSVLEPLQGLAAMRKARELLQGKTVPACILVGAYLVACGGIASLFRAVVVYGSEELDIGVLPRFLVGASLVSVLVVVNFVGLLVQSVFYYVCKSYHRQGIDKRLLGDHLGEYLGEYVPLKSTIPMENLNI